MRGRRPSEPAEKRGLVAWFRKLLGLDGGRVNPTRAEQEGRALADFQQHFRVSFGDLDLLKLALTHRSYLSVTGQGPRESNERLEFLGDSVLGLVTSEFLYRAHPDEHEGDLTKSKSLLVSKAILSRRALAMGLGRFVLMSHSEVESGGRQRLSILADAFEAVIGAIYLDQGFEPARAFIHRWLLRESGEIVADKRHTNYKSHLQEYVQSTWRTHPVYRIRSEMGPDHSKHFLVEVLVGKRGLGDGRGRNKKEAEQAAARNALDRAGVAIGQDEPETHATETLPEPSQHDDAGYPADVAYEREDAVAGDDSDAGARRRGRRGSRDDRPRAADRDDERGSTRDAVAPTAQAMEIAPAETPVGRLAVPSRQLAPLPELPPAKPALPEKEPPPADTEEDDTEEVGRPEGPLEELHVDPYAWEDEPARDLEPSATEERADHSFSRVGSPRGIAEDDAGIEEESELASPAPQPARRVRSRATVAAEEAVGEERESRPAAGDAGERGSASAARPPVSFGRRRSRRG